MSFRIERGEPIPDAVRRIAAEEIDGAQADRSQADREAAVHSIRKRFKRLRALLRLLGESVPHSKAYDAMLRDAGRTLAHARDHRVTCDTARRLAELGGEAGPAMDRVVHALAFRGPTEPDLGKALDALGEPLAAMRAEVTGWSPDGTPDSGAVASLGPALRKTYQRGRRRYAEALAWPSAEHFHEWRKRVKDLWYQVTLLEGLDPSLGPLVDDLDTLGDTLGLDHDHAVLDILVGHGTLCTDDDQILVRQALAAERERLQAIAWPLGERLFAAEPDAFVASVLPAPPP